MMSSSTSLQYSVASMPSGTSECTGGRGQV